MVMLSHLTGFKNYKITDSLLIPLSHVIPPSLQTLEKEKKKQTEIEMQSDN